MQNIHVFYVLADPVQDVDKMYYSRSGNKATAAALGDWVCIRGDSKLEGYHNHLADMLSGNNYSCEMADRLLIIGNCRWNIDRGVQNAKQQDFGCYDLWQIDEINKNMESLGKPIPYPTWKLPKLPDSHQEQFGVQYRAPELDLVNAVQEVERQRQQQQQEQHQQQDPSAGGRDRHCGGCYVCHVCLSSPQKQMLNLFRPQLSDE